MSTLAPQVAPKPLLGPTVLTIPVVQTYMFGDFMRAFGIDESTIRTAQQGYQAGDFVGIEINGYDANNVPQERSRLIFDDVVRTGTLTLDTSSQVSMTEQLSRKLAGCIAHSANTMRRQGLRVGYSYLFSAKGNANFHATLQRYGLVSGEPDRMPPGMAHRQIYSINHAPTGTTVSHSSLRRVR